MADQNKKLCEEIKTLKKELLRKSLQLAKIENNSILHKRKQCCHEEHKETIIKKHKKNHNDFKQIMDNVTTQLNTISARQDNIFECIDDIIIRQDNIISQLDSMKKTIKSHKCVSQLIECTPLFFDRKTIDKIIHTVYTSNKLKICDSYNRGKCHNARCGCIHIITHVSRVCIHFLSGRCAGCEFGHIIIPESELSRLKQAFNL